MSHKTSGRWRTAIARAEAILSPQGFTGSPSETAVKAVLPANDTCHASQEALDALVCDAAPRQGCWTEADYLWLTDRAEGRIEFTDGHIELLPMPTLAHQLILGLLYEAFVAWVRPRGGVVVFSGLRLRVRENKFREPDLLLLCDRHEARNRFWLGADLVLEVVSPDGEKRDWVQKRADYAEGRIPEYWIVDPPARTLTVLTLANEAYTEHGVFGDGDTATSVLLPGFSVDVTALFDAARESVGAT